MASLDPTDLLAIANLIATIENPGPSAAAVAAIKTELDTVEGVVLAIGDSVNGHDSGGPSVGALLLTVQSEVNTIGAAVADLSDALAALSARLGSAGDPVTLPTVPPAGYAGPDPGSLVSEIWGFQIGGVGNSMSTYVQAAGRYGATFANTGWVVVDWWYARAITAPNDAGSVPGAWPVLDLNDLVLGETLLAMLTRQNPGALALYWWSGPDGPVGMDFDSDMGRVTFLTLINGPWLDRFQYFRYTPTSGAPQRSTLGDTNQLLTLIPFQFGG